MSTERRNYQTPPISEALCTLTFSNEKAWATDQSIPTGIWRALRDDYPQIPERQPAGKQLTIDGNGQAQVVDQSFRYLFRSEEGHRLVIAGPTALGVSCHAPYEGWEHMRARLARAVGGISTVPELALDTEHLGVGVLGLRYINRITIPAAQMDTDDYFTLHIRTAENNSATFIGLFQRIESQHMDGKTRTSITFARLQSETKTDSVTFLVDIDMYREVSNLDSLEGLLASADDMKRLENDEFESLITDKCRDLFS